MAYVDFSLSTKYVHHYFHSETLGSFRITTTRELEDKNFVETKIHICCVYDADSWLVCHYFVNNNNMERIKEIRTRVELKEHSLKNVNFFLCHHQLIRIFFGSYNDVLQRLWHSLLKLFVTHYVIMHVIAVYAKTIFIP